MIKILEGRQSSPVEPTRAGHRGPRGDKMHLTRPRSSIAYLMLAIALLSIWLTSIRAATPVRASASLSITVVVLVAAFWRALFANSAVARSWWSGFSLFGWGHLLLAGSEWRHNLPTDWLIDHFMDQIMVEYLPFPKRGPNYTDAMHATNGEFWKAGRKMATCNLTLMIAWAGDVITNLLATQRARQNCFEAK